MIAFQNAASGYGDTLVFREISFTVPKGSVTALIGPNGCGKTTLLRAAAGQLPLWEGNILLNGRPVSAYSRREFAKAAAFMPQVRAVPPMTVRELVSNGRFPYLGLSRRLGSADRELIERAMEQTGVYAWADRDLRALSGGERQRAYIAMALAQDTGLIFLDEPTTYLDLHHQFELLELIRRMNTLGKTIVMVLHDLSHALQYSDQVVLLEQGHLVFCGAPDILFESGRLETVFRIRAHKTPDGYCFTPEEKIKTTQYYTE